jgi:hypothetical protein
LFSLVIDDKMAWDNIGENPSKIKTDYIIAYFSLIAGRNMGAEFKAANVTAADSTEIRSIINVRKAITHATKAGLNLTEVWKAFRAGDYQKAAALLANMPVGIQPGNDTPFRADQYRAPLKMRVYTAHGREIYSGTGTGFTPSMLQSAIHGQIVFISYRYTDGRTLGKKLFVAP